MFKIIKIVLIGIIILIGINLLVPDAAEEIVESLSETTGIDEGFIADKLEEASESIKEAATEISEDTIDEIESSID